MKKITFLALLFLCGCATAQIPSAELRSNYVQSHPNLSQQTKDAILGGHILTGMTIEEVRASRPEYSWCLKRPDTSSYGPGGSSAAYRCYHTYFNFHNDKLDSVNRFDD